ncbi:hypothetical protein RAA17_13995 [Komagataeibacter rhaeticus]|nr:hypothetical protein [Komagataeibacter rhaeticus]
MTPPFPPRRHHGLRAVMALTALSAALAGLCGPDLAHAAPRAPAWPTRLRFTASSAAARWNCATRHGGDRLVPSARWHGGGGMGPAAPPVPLSTLTP